MGDQMRRIAIALTALGAMLLGASSAQAAVLTSSGSVIYYIANQGERNDVVVGTDANPIQIGGGACELINGVGTCRQTGITSFYVDVRDGDDTAQVATAGLDGAFPPTIGAVLIGGRGIDVLTGGLGGDILKGNDGRDSLRGREGRDTYKGGRGRDNLQTLDGIRDTFISCGDGAGDVVRKDKIDPPAHHCESSNHGNPSKPH